MIEHNWGFQSKFLIQMWFEPKLALKISEEKKISSVNESTVIPYVLVFVKWCLSHLLPYQKVSYGAINVKDKAIKVLVSHLGIYL